MPDGLCDVIELATPQPVVVVKVWIPLCAATTCAVTRGAILCEGRLSDGARKLRKLRIGTNLRQRSRSEFREQRPTIPPQHRDIVSEAFTRMPAGQPGRIRADQRP